jgi:hypothetical protein
MAWASVRCKSQDQRGTARGHALLLAALFSYAPQFTGGSTTEPHPTPAHSFRLSGGLIPAICATPRIATLCLAPPRPASQLDPTGEGNLPTPHLSACGCQVG